MEDDQHLKREKDKRKIITILDRECRSESQSVERLDEQRTKPPRLEHPSIFKLLRHRLSATKRPNSSLQLEIIKWTQLLT